MSVIMLKNDSDMQSAGNSNTGSSETMQMAVKIHRDDARMLYRLKDTLGVGNMKKRKPNLLTYRISGFLDLEYILNKLNGLIMLKGKNFKLACLDYGMEFKEPNYVMSKNSAYLAGLMDTDGSCMYNESRRRMELSLEFNDNEYTSKLDLSEVMPGYTVW
ncbi:hypothetical protein DAMA08_020890, partial (mitochondrion) [Martiniozyma asiatica (nom. inval.)]